MKAVYQGRRSVLNVGCCAALSPHCCPEPIDLSFSVLLLCDAFGLLTFQGDGWQSTWKNCRKNEKKGSGALELLH